jgi:gamma-glutamyl phosphate reductase
VDEVHFCEMESNMTEKSLQTPSAKASDEALKGIADSLERIAENTWSPNVMDDNGEPANLVDALALIASSLREVANAIKSLKA